MVPEIGKKYGPYEILGHLGGGGMGFVYRAWDARLHREVAIKLLHSEYTMPGMRERFLREARAASALNHPNICTIFDIGEQSGEPYLVMELLQGQTLKDLIDYRTIQLDEILQIAREVAEALGAAHAKGVIHRDIKPANIFLVDKPNGSTQAKVLDFGLAKFQGGVLGARTNRSLDLTAAGATVGTLAYMSPEQARGEVLDSRSDLFSLGVVLYEMATRRIPFPGATSALVFVQLLNQQPESVRNWNESIPRELDRIIFKLMSKERTQRYQTAQELEEVLAKVGEKGGGWLRKATSNVPLVRAADPVAREKRVGRKSGDSHIHPSRVGQTPTPASATTAPRASDGESQFLRPVVRMPRTDPSPTPLSDAADVAAVGKAQSETPGSSNVAVESGGGVVHVQAAQQLDIPEFSDSTDFHHDDSSRRQANRINRSGFAPSKLAIFIGAMFALVAVAFLVKRGHFRTTIVDSHDVVVLTEVENKTGDSSLDGVVGEGLQIALAQSPYLHLSQTASYLRAMRQVSTDAADPLGQVLARKAVEKMHAKVYLFGQITGTSAPYRLHLDVLDTASNDVLSSVDERVPSSQDICAVIDHLATTLRSNLGESRDSISKFSNPLNQEATTSREALHAVSQGAVLEAEGKTLDALRLYQQAASVDPKFVQVQLRLAVLYRRERAEVEAAEAAKLAVNAADHTSPRTKMMAQYEYEMNGTGDYAHAATIMRQWVATNPHDADALEKLARCLRLEGRVAEALQTAQQAIAEDPFSVDAYLQAENSLLGLDRFAAAAQMDAQIQKFGTGRLGGALITAYLEGRTSDVDAAASALQGLQNGFRPDWNLGIYLDNVGRLAAGYELWRSRAGAAMKVNGLQSAAGFLLSQGAVDRALLGDCPAGLAMAREADAHPEGITAMFNVAMADALCGDSARAQKLEEDLQQLYPQSFAVKGFYVADIKAGIALHDQDPTAALDLLTSARQYDLISLTPVLRGRAHVALQQVQIGIVDFQTVLSHRGVPFIVGNVSYPVAQIGVARAFAATGDVGNSAEAYRRFLELWKTADATQPLVTEALVHTR